MSDMRMAFGSAVQITLMTGALLLGFGETPAANATEWPTLNGTYAATSDGQWAKTRDVFHDEATITSTWTISSTCTTHVDCTGTVTSDQGWSADAHYNGGLWFVEHDLPAWQPCGDGATAPGEQQFSFYRVDATTLTGKDKTTGPSGSCGVSALLTIEMPFELNKIG